MKNGFVRFVLFILLQHAAKAYWVGPKVDPATGTYYYISTYKAHQPEAKRACRLNGWILATIADSSQQKIIQRLANEGNVRENIWIGLELYQNGSNPYGVWADGTKFQVGKKSKSYKNWGPWEPQTFIQTTQTIWPTCVRLWFAMSWRWDDFYCNQPKSLSYFACEAKATEFYKPTDLTRIGEDILENTAEVGSSASNVESISNAMNELLTVPEEYYEDKKPMSREVLGAFDAFLNNYDAAKEGDFYTNKTNLEIAAAQKSKNDTYLINERDSRNGSYNKIEIYLTAELLEEAANRSSEAGDEVQVNSIFYRKPSLFQVDDKRYSDDFSNISKTAFKSRVLNTSLFGEQPALTLLPRLLTDVISVEVKDTNMTKLNNFVCIANHDYLQNYTPPVIEDMVVNTRPLCGFWDHKINEWSTDGCVTYKVATEDNICKRQNPRRFGGATVICKCNHMTHFSVLLDTTYTYAPRYLEHMTIAGCTLSIACLFAAIVTILSFRQLRSKTAQRILLQLCINLLILNILFLAGIDRRDNKVVCTVMSALMHFFLLAAWAWMLVEAIFLFLRLVVTYYNRGIRGRIIPVGVVLAYGIPGIISGFTVRFTPEDNYLSQKYCWLSMDILIPSLLVPIALVLVTNTVIFIAVMYSITFKSKIYRKRLDLSKMRQTMSRAFCMIFILGIPWIFGFFMLLAQDPKMKEVFATWFTILNTTQGVAIFFFFCARQEQVRKLWMAPLNSRFRKTIRRIRSVKKPPITSDADTAFQQAEDGDKTTQLDDTRTTNTLTKSTDKKRTSLAPKESRIDEESITVEEASSSTTATDNTTEKKPYRQGWS